MKRSGTIALALAGLALTASLSIGAAAAVDQTKAAAAVKARQQLLKSMSGNMKVLGAIAQGKAPVDAAVMKANAAQLAAYSRKIDAAFAMDTRGATAKTEARDLIWQNKAEFSKKSAALRGAADKLVAASASGKSAAFGGAVVAVGQACKDCHKTFRTD